MTDEANAGDAPDSKAWDLTPGAAKCLAWLPAGFEGREKAQMCLMQSIGIDPLLGSPRCSRHHTRTQAAAPPLACPTPGCTVHEGIHGAAVHHVAGCPTLVREMEERLAKALPPEEPRCCPRCHGYPCVCEPGDPTLCIELGCVRPAAVTVGKDRCMVHLNEPLAAGAAAVAAKPGEGVKADGGKLRLELESQAARMGLAAVLTYGAKKYEDDNWRKGMGWRRLIGAAQRHLAAFAAGEDNDPESGLPHIDHAACCLHFLSEYQKTGRGTDDRFVEGPFVPRGEATS